MSKVKPQVGQVWSDPYREGDEWVVTEFLSHEGIVKCSHNKYSGIMPDAGANAFFESDFVKFFEFVPQNDLEWLAVKVGAWRGEESADGLVSDYVHKSSEFSYFYSIDSSHGHARQQWQNMRYKLGLDEKPRVSSEKWAEMLRNKQ